MPYIMVIGSISQPLLSKDDGSTVYGLKSEERVALTRELNSSFGMQVATVLDQERTVRISQKGLTLVVVNRIHGLLGYDVVSHSMAMTNANRELISFTMYKKSHSHPQSNLHAHRHTSESHSPSRLHSHRPIPQKPPHSTHSNVVTL